MPFFAGGQQTNPYAGQVQAFQDAGYTPKVVGRTAAFDPANSTGLNDSYRVQWTDANGAPISTMNMPGQFIPGYSPVVGGHGLVPTGGPPTHTQADFDAMIRQAMDPMLQQLKQQQQSLAEMYQQQQQQQASPGGPFGFLSAPMHIPLPTKTGDSWTFNRPSYGAPVDRGFNPGGFTPQPPPKMPGFGSGPGGVFQDQFLGNLASLLFGDASWLPKGAETGGAGLWSSMGPAFTQEMPHMGVPFMGK